MLPKAYTEVYDEVKVTYDKDRTGEFLVGLADWRGEATAQGFLQSR